MRQYEADTWYDANGRIIFTASKGLPGVGLSRKAIKGDTSYTVDTSSHQGTNICFGVGGHPSPRSRRHPPPDHGPHPTR